MPECILIYFGFLFYEPLININEITTVGLHDVMSIASMPLDLKARNLSKNANIGMYDVDQYNAYITADTLAKLNNGISQTTEYCLDQDCIIMDASQWLASVIVNIRDISDSS